MGHLFVRASDDEEGLENGCCCFCRALWCRGARRKNSDGTSITRSRSKQTDRMCYVALYRIVGNVAMSLVDDMIDTCCGLN